MKKYKQLGREQRYQIGVLLENHQTDSYYDAIIAAKEILEERDIDTTQYQNRENKAKHKENKRGSEFNIPSFIISIGMFTLGIYLISNGYAVFVIISSAIFPPARLALFFG